MQMRLTTYTITLLLLLSGIALGADLGTAQKADTKAALSALETWLGKGKAAEGWSQYLELPALRAQTDGSGAPNTKVLGAVLAHLQSGAPGLDLIEFDRLRKSLSAWVDTVTVPDPAQISAALEKAKSDYQPATAADLAAAKARLETAIAALDKYLTSIGNLGVGWRNYLDLAGLKKELAAGPAALAPVPASPEPKDGNATATDDSAAVATDEAAPAAENVANSHLQALDKIHDRFVANAPGLELPVFLAAGDALEEYIELAEASAPVPDDGKAPKPADQHVTQLADLTKSLTDYQAKPTEELAATINRQLTSLWRQHLDRKLVTLIHRAFDKPNLYVAIQEGFIAQGIERPVSEKNAPISDNILGTQISGRATTVGQLKLELVPAPSKAVFDALLSATVSTNTVGQNGPATIYAQGTTQIAGRKRISVDALGIHTVPATAAAVTRSRITGVAVSGLGQGIAEQRVAEGKGQAEQVGARHAEARLKTRLDNEMATNLAKANHNFAENFRNPLLRRRQFPTIFELSTTPDLVEVEVLEASASQLGASTDPPNFAEWEKTYPVVAVLHQSAANNGAFNFLAGVTLNDDEVRQKIIDLNNGQPPKWLTENEDQEPWSIRFAKFRPISLEVGDGTLTVTVRGQRYTTGEDKKRHAAMYITAVYKIEKSDAGPTLVRQGELDIAPPNFDPKTSTLSTGQIALRRVLQRKFGKMFPPTVEPKPMELGGQWKGAGTLVVDQLAAKDGWVSAAYRWVPKTAEEKAAAQKTAALADPAKSVARQD
jgi:hypothetical protein